MLQNVEYACMRTEKCKSCHQEKNLLLYFSPRCHKCKECVRKKKRGELKKMGTDPKFRWGHFNFRKRPSLNESNTWVA